MPKLGPEYLNMKAIRDILISEGYGLSLPRLVTQSETIQNDDGVIHVDASGGAVTITLIDAAGYNGPGLTIKKIDDTFNEVIVNKAVGGQKIDGEDSYTMQQQYETVFFYSDGTNWFIK